MARYAAWDPNERLIELDLSGAELDARAVDTVCEEMIQIARLRRPDKPFVLVNWTGGRFLPDGVRRFDERVPGLYQYVRAIVRYGADDVVTRVGLRADTIRFRLQDLKTHLYDTREEALAALRCYETSGAERGDIER